VLYIFFTLGHLTFLTNFLATSHPVLTTQVEIPLNITHTIHFI